MRPFFVVHIIKREKMPQLTYLFDPLCGWCYGASHGIAQLAQQHPIRLLPTGLFSQTGRTMSPEFARHAWENDQRIAQISGATFSPAYRDNILNQPSAFDSFPAIVALTAVAQTAPEQELAALQRFQAARYVRGLDIADYAVLADLLREQGLPPAADLLHAHSTHEHAKQRIAAGQALAQKLGASGVPQVVEQGEQGDRLLPSQMLFQAA